MKNLSMKELTNNFCIFIMSHERVDKIKIPRSDFNFYVVVDDADKDLEKYKKKFKNKLLIFNKKQYFNKSDSASLESWGYKGQVFAYNFCLDFAKQNNIKYFLLLDDDYNNYQLRYKQKFKLKCKIIKTSIDEYILQTVNFLHNCERVTAVAWSQGGDYTGSVQWRKLMNAIFCSSDRLFRFVGFQNEDVCTYTHLGNKGYLFLTLKNPMVQQQQTQKNSGGFTEIYKKYGTYFKSIFAILFMPSAVKISTMGNKYRRIHHKIDWDFCVPKLLKSDFGTKGV